MKKHNFLYPALLSGLLLCGDALCEIAPVTQANKASHIKIERFSDAEIIQMQRYYASALADLVKWRQLQNSTHNAFGATSQNKTIQSDASGSVLSDKSLFDDFLAQAQELLDHSNNSKTTQQDAQKSLLKCRQILLNLLAITQSKGAYHHKIEGSDVSVHQSYAGSDLQTVSSSHYREPLPKAKRAGQSKEKSGSQEDLNGDSLVSYELRERTVYVPSQANQTAKNGPLKLLGNMDDVAA